MLCANIFHYKIVVPTTHNVISTSVTKSAVQTWNFLTGYGLVCLLNRLIRLWITVQVNMN